MKVFRSAAAAAVFAAAASGVSAQMLATGVSFESYSFGEPSATGVKSVTLLTAPFGIALRPVSFARVLVSGAFASGKAVSVDGTENSISGLTDTSIGLAIPIAQDRLTLGATLILPTGKSTYTAGEAQVAGVIAADLLPFRITNWGSGGALDLSTAVTVPLGAINVGARVGYQQAQEFELLEGGDFTYRPGNQLYGRVAADGSVGAGRLSAEVSMYKFSEDQVEAENLYQSGDRLNGLLTYTQPVGRSGSAAVYAGAMKRQHGTFLDGSGETPSQTLILFGGGLRRSLGTKVLVPAFDMRLLRSEDGVGQGYVAGIGATLEVGLSNDNVTLLPMARARFGNLIVRDGVETGISGFEVGAGLRFGRTK